jgi:lipoate-protein ligase A
MYVVRGSVADPDADRRVTRELAAMVERTGRPGLRAWTPPRQVAFGRRDASADGYARGRQAAADRGYDPVERRVGGRAVAYTGETLAFVHAVPTSGDRTGMQDRYEAATTSVAAGLEAVGADVRRGEPPDAFCPGDHSLQAGGKVAGIAQRVQRGVAVVGGCVVVAAGDEVDIAGVLEPVYGVLGVPFDPETVGSIENAGGPRDPDAVAGAVQRAFVGDREPEHRQATAFSGDAGRDA